MADPHNLVVPKVESVSPLRFHAALIAGLARVAARVGRGNLADKSDRTPKALGKLFSGDSMDTSGKGLCDFLLADPTALDEVLAIYGFGIHRLPEASGSKEDHTAIADVLALANIHADAMRDGHRDHRETQTIANAARPVVQAYCGIIAEADGHKGLRAA